MFKVFSDLFDRAMLALMNPDELIPAFLPERIRGLITWFLSMMALLGSVPLPLSPGPNIELRSTVMQSRILAIILYRNQNRILYHPVIPGTERDPSANPAKYRNPQEWGMPYEDVALEAADGTKLHAWFIKQPNPDMVPTLIFFQENAGNMGLRLPSMHMLWSNLRVNIFMLSYRGYGRSEGEPDEVGLMQDADAAILHVASRSDVDARRILVHGRSLGGAVGCFVAEKYPEMVKGLVLENTFTSIADMVDVVLPWVAPLKNLVLRIGWRSIERVPSITAPILFISGLKDELVPPEHMRRLHDAATKSIAREMYTVQDGMHNDTCYRDPAAYVRAYKEWMLKINA